MIDTNVFIHFERVGRLPDLSALGRAEKAYLSVVTVAELLMGVQRADSEARRQRRSAFVEAVIAGVGVLDFTIACARLHAEIYGNLARNGLIIGAHDLILAATARCHGLAVLTENVDEFSRVDGLRVIPFRPGDELRAN